MKRALWLVIGYPIALAALAIEPAAGAQPVTNPVEGPAGNKSICKTVPAINPNLDFVGNFNNSCYAIPLATAAGGEQKAGDLNAKYQEIYYHVAPGYELVAVGTFPNARYFAFSVYDSHAVQTSGFLDNTIVPLYSGMVNPFVLGNTFVANQSYGLRIGFGSGNPVTVAAGCSTTGTTLDQNYLDASLVHQGPPTWTGYPNLPPHFPPHLTGANTGGGIIVRSYLDISSESPVTMIVRQISNGCAMLATDAVSKSILSLSSSVGAGWQSAQQVDGHSTFANSILPVYCYPPDPNNAARWISGTDYVPGNNIDAVYLSNQITTGLVESLVAGQQFIRMRFQDPTTPAPPCTTGTCTFTGQEQLRYRSISFQVGESTLASVADSSFVRDPNGYVTLLFGMGTQPLSYVNAANYYTYIDLSQKKNYTLMNSMIVRDILPNASFNCSDWNIPLLTTEYNLEGGFMGNYVPTVDYPTSVDLPAIPVPVVRPNTCSIVPTQTPTICGGNQ